uniref:Uncharacterized protein n=1 Tax=Arundo donax TaxID=35708 RepID=A0A0A9HAK3_ARUDO
MSLATSSTAVSGVLLRQSPATRRPFPAARLLASGAASRSKSSRPLVASQPPPCAPRPPPNQVKNPCPPSKITF